MPTNRLKYDKKKKKWIGESPLIVELDKPIENVKEFGESLAKFLEWQKEEMPINILNIRSALYEKRWDGKEIFFSEGAVIIQISKFSRWTKFRKHYRISKSTIVIDYRLGSKKLEVFQEKNLKEMKDRFVWTLKIEEIEALLKKLEQFVGGYWLGIHNLL